MSYNLPEDCGRPHWEGGNFLWDPEKQKAKKGAESSGDPGRLHKLQDIPRKLIQDWSISGRTLEGGTTKKRRNLGS